MMCLLAVSTPTENLKVTKPFQQWMDDHANFRDICEEGKGKMTSPLIKDNFPLINEKLFRQASVGARHPPGRP